MDSGVREGIQKLGRLWLEGAAELVAVALEDSAELMSVLMSVLHISLPLFCPEEKNNCSLLFLLWSSCIANAFNNKVLH